MKYSRSGTRPVMGENQDIDRRAAEIALAFGSLIRSRRKGLNMRQDDLALATGVGRRFLIDLEAGKSSWPAWTLPSGGRRPGAQGARPSGIYRAGHGRSWPGITGPPRRRRGVGRPAYPYTLSSGLSAPSMLIGVVPVSPMLLAGSD